MAGADLVPVFNLLLPELPAKADVPAFQPGGEVHHPQAIILQFAADLLDLLVQFRQVVGDRDVLLTSPLCLDEVARDFPEMTIIADCGGWPWVPDMIGVARRHQNVYIDTAAHRPKYFATPGSGWEMLMQFGNTLLQDRIVFASGWSNYQMPIGDVVEEMRALPLKDDVKEKWLYRNAARLFET